MRDGGTVGVGDRRGTAFAVSRWLLETGLPLAIAAGLLFWVWRQGMPPWLGLVCLLLISPMVGEFAETMAWRYRPGLSTMDALRRLTKQSRCDSCDRGLGQLDIVPVLPFVLRGGQCSCGRYKIPAACTITGMVVLAVTATICAFYYLIGSVTSAVAPIVVFLSLVPAIVADLRHGEVDGWLVALAVPGCLALHYAGFVPLEAAGLALASLAATGLITAGVQWKFRPFAFGLVDFLLVGVTALALDIRQVVSANMWLFVALAVWHAAVWVAQRWEFGRRWTAKFGPIGEYESIAPPAPMVPCIAAAVVLAMIWPLA